MSQNETNSENSVISDLENENYLNPNENIALINEVRSKIEEFSSWFNGTARLCLLRCPPQESETFIYLLLNLKKKLKFAISEINRSVSNSKHSFTCNVCGQNTEVQPWQHMWSTLQGHSHFEEIYSKAIDSNIIENGETSTNGSVVDDLSEDLNAVELNQTVTAPLEVAEKPPENGLNNFKFNFVVNYDERIEEAFYPEPLIKAARQRDNVPDYTIQRCGVGRGICLLCRCNLISIGRAFKITPFIVKNHVLGQKHLKYASTPLYVNALRQYHDFWRSQDPNYQAHQVHFTPEVTDLSFLKCQLCQEFVKFNSIIEHIRDKIHKSKLLKIYTTPEIKLNEFYLLEMQIEIYEDVPKSRKLEHIEKIKDGSKSGSSNNSPNQKCIFLKFKINPNGLNLPPRYKEHLDFFTQNADNINCKICQINFSNNSIAMKQHVLNSHHRQTAGLALQKYNYFCEICNVFIKDEAAWDYHFIKGPNRHESLSQMRKEKVAEYECKTCMTVIYGDELSLSRHISSRTNKSGKGKEVRLPFSVKKLFKSKEFIESEAKRLQLEAKQVFEYQEKMKECCSDLEEALSGMYPGCKAYPFGSRTSGLGNNHSDLDVFMDIGDMYFGEKYQDAQSQEQFVKRVAKILKNCKDDFARVFPIPSARTPIVKLYHNYTNLACDLSFRHGLGVENTKFLRFCIDLQPITQPFILLLKKWSEYCKLNEHITNYGLALMAVFFLQTGGYLLPVKTIRNYNPTESYIIDGWETLNYTVPINKMKEFVKPYPGSIKQLLRDFFFYFSEFDYANQVVCPLLGNTIPKLLFNEKPEESLPVEMKSYVQRIQNDSSEQFRSLTPFCVQDPFDLSHNLTKACQQGTISKLKALCTLTYDFLDKIE